MMSNLNILLSEYKILTLKAIEEASDAEKLSLVLADRQIKIDEISKLNYEKSEFIDIANELNLLNLDRELNKKVQKEKLETKKALDNVRRLRQARRSYNALEGTPRFFSKTT